MAGRLKPLAGVPKRIFPRGPISLIAPRLKIGLGALRQERLPCVLEIGAGFVEGRGGVGLMFTPTRSRIEAAAPFRPISIVRVADALGDRSGVDTPASPSMGSPLATIFSTPSGNGRCSLLASSHGADGHA
jgi:hypothetical protein